MTLQDPEAMGLCSFLPSPFSSTLFPVSFPLPSVLTSSSSFLPYSSLIFTFVCFISLIRSLSIWIVWSPLQKWILGWKKSEFWETSCHPWIFTNQHKCVSCSPQNLTASCTALWGLAKRTNLFVLHVSPRFPYLVSLKRQGKIREPKPHCAPLQRLWWSWGLRTRPSGSVSAAQSAQLERAHQGHPLCINLGGSFSLSLISCFFAAKSTHSSDN